MAQQKRKSFRVRLASAVLGSHKKEFIQALSPTDGWMLDSSGRLNNYTTKPEQLGANVGWCYTANESIVNPTAAIKLKLFRKKKDGDREEVTEGEPMAILELLDSPNLVHTGEQLRQLHFTYMNFVGESYIYMIKGGESFIPAKGRLPDALQIMPAHRIKFELGSTYTKSTVKIGQDVYPMLAFIRDLYPDPNNPFYGRSVIAAAAAAIDTENQMKEWNRRFFANNARPSLVFKSDEEMSDEAYARWKEQFNDEATGTENAYKPLLIEGGDVSTLISQNDLDFINSRKFSRDEILAMWRVSPGVIGSVENVNKANLEAGFYIHALINEVPRIRQFCRQITSTLIAVYDPTLELDFESPIPEDEVQKLKAATTGVNKIWTIDEVRDMYGEKPLPDGLGEQFYVPVNTMRLDAVGEEPAAGVADDAGDKPVETPGAGDVNTDKAKALGGVKKKI